MLDYWFVVLIVIFLLLIRELLAYWACTLLRAWKEFRVYLERVGNDS